LSRKKIRAIYVDIDDWDSFKQVCKREGIAVSVKLNDFIRVYNQQHRFGNPQLLMSNYVDLEGPNPMHVRCRWVSGALSDGRVFCDRKRMWINGIQCYSCKYNFLRKQK
jgi:hypothetical protein